MSIANFDSVKRRLRNLGADTEVTHYKLTLGAKHTTTKQYLRGYAPTDINMVIIPHTPAVASLTAGVHAHNVATGYSDTQILEGDRIEDSNAVDYVITAVKDLYVGDKNVYYECELAMSSPTPTTGTIYPWPAPPTESGLTLNVGVALFDASMIETILETCTDSEDLTALIATVIDLAVV